MSDLQADVPAGGRAQSDSLPPQGLEPTGTPLSMELSRQEYWSGLPVPPPGDCPNSGIKPASPVAPALAGWFFTTAPLGSPTTPGHLP